LGKPVLAVNHLSVTIDGIDIVDDVSFALDAGKTLALVGESGCGKSITALALMRLLPEIAEVTGGSLRLDGKEISRISEKEMQSIRGNDISMIFQESGSALDPLMTVGDQVVESIQAHRNIPRPEAVDRTLELFGLVGISEARTRLKQYPFELSGGMCQRIMIAAALACRPAVLIADEPTTALDVTIQAQILDLIRKMREEIGTAVILITHDMGVVADMADQVAVMYAGRVVEQGDVFEIFREPRHPYTRLLLKSIPRIDGRQKESLHIIEGVVPDARNWPPGCRFHTRCPLADDTCRCRTPKLEPVRSDDYFVACWKHLNQMGSNG
jgi:oligopeptide/dipeptide ABC transporter ATP-binding protein